MNPLTLLSSVHGNAIGIKLKATKFLLKRKLFMTSITCLSQTCHVTPPTVGSI